MHVDVGLTINLHVTSEEARIIGFALMGQLKDQDREAANDLNIKILELKAKKLSEMKEQAEKALVSAKKL